MLIFTIEPAGAFHAFPDRMGSVNSSTRTRGASRKAVYRALSTFSGELSSEGR